MPLPTTCTTENQVIVLSNNSELRELQNVRCMMIQHAQSKVIASKCVIESLLNSDYDDLKIHSLNYMLDEMTELLQRLNENIDSTRLAE